MLANRASSKEMPALKPTVYPILDCNLRFLDIILVDFPYFVSSHDTISLPVVIYF